MTRIATSWLIYKLTGSALLLGVVGFAGQIRSFSWRRSRACWSTVGAGTACSSWTQVLAMLQSSALAVLTLTGTIRLRT